MRAGESAGPSAPLQTEIAWLSDVGINPVHPAAASPIGPPSAARDGADAADPVELERASIPVARLAATPVPTSPAAEAVLMEPVGPGRPLTWPFRVMAAIGRTWERTFGFVSLLVILAGLAALPVVQLLSFGYLLEVSGRMVRTRRYGAGFIGLDRTARIGGIVLGTWLTFLPVRLIADMWYSSLLIAPGAPSTAAWRVGLFAATGVALLHCLMAWLAGGKLRHFFWPLLAVPALSIWLARRLFAAAVPVRTTGDAPLTWLERLAADVGRTYPLRTWFPPAALLALVRRGRPWAEMRDATLDFVAALRPWYYFLLGLKGLLGAVVWLSPPTLLIVASVRVGEPGGFVLLLAGLIGLAVVATYLPLVQTRFAATGRWLAHFDVLAARRLFRRAPLALMLAITVTLAFAIPLYLLKVTRTPPETFWLSALVFVAFIWPARYLLGAAATLAARREDPSWRWFPVRWLGRLVLLPIVGLYALLILATQYVCWNGTWSLLEQHAFLVPVPFLNL